MSHHQFPAIVARARRVGGMTAAQMDYSLSAEDGHAMAWLYNAAWDIANEGHPEVTEGRTDIALERETRAKVLWDDVWADVEAMVAAAKTKSYTGWSIHSTGPIQYAR